MHELATAKLALLATTALGLARATGCRNGIEPPKPPDLRLAGQTKCAVSKSQARPLIVEWPSADRAALEWQLRRGVVAVRYAGCEMEVLPQCAAPGGYVYAGVTRKRDRVSMHEAEDLYANIPVHAAKFESLLAKRGELNVSMTIVGRFEAERPQARADELQGDCAKATHVITGLTVGAFQFFAGSEGTAGASAGALGAGAGAKASSARETLNEDGDQAACDKSTEEDKKPPSGCGALLRIEVSPLGEARAQVASALATEKPPPSSNAPAKAPESSAVAEKPTAQAPPPLRQAAKPQEPAQVAAARREGAVLFDDFSDDAFKDRWTLRAGLGSITSGVLSLVSRNDWAHVLSKQALSTADYSLSARARLRKGHLIELMLHVDGTRYVRIYVYKVESAAYIGDGRMDDDSGGGPTLVNAPVKIVDDQWYQLVATAKGNSYSLSVDGKKVVSYVDSKGLLSKKGTVGLMVNGDADFDDVRVTPPLD